MAGPDDDRKMETVQNGVPRPVRVPIPVRVEFAGETFSIDEFTANLSVGGLFLPSERLLEPGTRGRLTFRLSRWDAPFTVEGEVVRRVPPDHGTRDHSPGVGIRFLDLSPALRRRLERLLDGVQDGSVTNAIRRAVREEGRPLLEELRRRTADQKMMFAVSANGDEIEALIRDGLPAVVLRLFQNPRLTLVHVRNILRDTGLPARVLAAVKQNPRWLATEEVRVLFCAHPAVPVPDAMQVLDRLSPASLVALSQRKDLRVPLVSRIGELVRARQRAGAR